MPLPGPIGSEAFWQAYKQALAGKVEPGAESRSTAGSVSAAIAAYYMSSKWKDELSDGTRAMRRAILEHFRERYGQWPLRHINENFLTAYLENLRPHAARNHLKALRGLLRQAKHDITRGITAPKAKSDKHPSWPPEIMAQYEARHPVGTKARLAFALARYTGAGRSEVAKVGPQHIVDGGEIIIARKKTGVPAHIPMHPELCAIIEASPITGLTSFLITKTGKPFSPNDLSDEFRQWCDQAGLPPQYTLHGLRHSLGDALAETGSNPNEIASVLGHAGARSALHYTQGADRKRMARTAMARLIGTKRDRPGNAEVSNEDPGLTLGAAKPLKDQANG
ncbi:MAG: tyrosine-type recombinase/integrase [Xanthobacteraceae bacterium]